MVEKSSHTKPQGSRRVTRRTFVKAAGAGCAMTGLSGCIYGDSGSGGGGTVQFGFGPTAVQENGDAIKQAFRDNGLSEDVSVEWVPGAEDTGTRRDNYNRLLRSGEANPDLLMMDNGWVNVFIQSDYLMNLSENAPGSVIDKIDNNYFEGFTATARDPSSDDLFGVPIFPDFPTMQYRKDFAREAGYGESDFKTWATEPMTWKEWSQLTKEIQDKTGTDHGFVTQWDIYEGTACCTFNEVMSSWGGAYFGGRDNLFGPVGERPVTVDKQPVVDSLKMMRTFVHGESDSEALDGYAGNIAPTAITSWKEEDARSSILGGDAVMQRNWPYAIALNARSPDDVDEDTKALGVENYGAMPIPYAVPEGEATESGTGGTTAALGGWHACVNPNTENTDAAMQVLEVMAKDDFQLKLLEIQGWLPPQPELFNSSAAQGVPVLGGYMDTLRVAGENVMARPVTSVWPNESSKIAQEANNAVAQAKSSSKAMSDLKSSLEQIENNA